MEKRAHADRVARLPPDLPDDMGKILFSFSFFLPLLIFYLKFLFPPQIDLMLECKDKEQAVFYIYRLYNLCHVDPSVLRPPASEESLRTKGRKSNKRAKAKALALAAEGKDNDGNEEVQGEEGNGEADADADDAGAAAVMDELEAEVKREAEEHDVPREVLEEVIQEVKSEGELDCGSGDEGVFVEVEEKPKKKARKRANRRGREEGGKRLAQTATHAVV